MRQQSKTTRGRSKPPKRKKGSGNGKTRRTPQQLERQERIFERNVMFGRTIRQLADEFGVACVTVMNDLRCEEARRSEENAARRAADKARALAFYDGVILKAQDKSSLYDTLLSERAGAKISDHTLDAMLKAQERKDKLLGLDAPTKVDIGLAELAESLKELDDPNRKLS